MFYCTVCTSNSSEWSEMKFIVKQIIYWVCMNIWWKYNLMSVSPYIILHWWSQPCCNSFGWVAWDWFFLWLCTVPKPFVYESSFSHLLHCFSSFGSMAGEWLLFFSCRYFKTMPYDAWMISCRLNVIHHFFRICPQFIAQI